MKKMLMLVAVLVAVGMVGTAFARDVLVPASDIDEGDRGNPWDYGDYGDSGSDEIGGSDSDNPGNSEKNINTDAGYECDCYTVVYGYEAACEMHPECCE